MRATQAPDYESREVIETIKQTVAKGATDAEFRMFIEICKSTGLNPFLKEIWCAVPMKDGQRSQYGQVLIMASRDGYLRVANEHPMFDGMQTVVERDEKTKTPIKATCTVWRKDRGHPIICEAYYSEYYKPGYNGKPGIWDIYKSAMVGKVSEIMSLKRSFSINGVLTEEEMGQQYAPPSNTEELQLAEGIDTGGHPVGTKEAAQAVAERKLAAMKEPKKSAVTKAATALKEELEKPVEADPELESIWRRMVDINSTCIEFAKLKDSMKDMAGEAGDRQYYSILSLHGVKHANEFRSQKPARLASKQCFEFLASFGAGVAAGGGDLREVTA
jgi:hypothetical protein